MAEADAAPCRMAASLVAAEATFPAQEGEAARSQEAEVVEATFPAAQAEEAELPAEEASGCCYCC